MMPFSKPCPEEEFRRIKCHYAQLSSTGCTRSFCQGGRMVHTDEAKVGGERSSEVVEAEAIDFLRQLRRDGIIETDEALQKRSAAVLSQIRRTSVSAAAAGIWTPTADELEHGLRLSWKHARKCIMRSEHSYLKLHDFRHVTTSEEMGQVLIDGMADAYNGGDIQPSVFVFPPKMPNRPGPMIWNQQFLSFAGYSQPDGTVLGDPATVGLTKAIMALGWTPPAVRTRWDLLPLVTMADGDEPFISHIPEHLFPLVHIKHPKHGLAFEKLGLRWVPAPALSQQAFDIGGVQYPATPFIGWFMDAEIGVRDLADTFRYNVLPSVASALGLLEHDVDELPQWERLAVLSRAQTELNYAVYWSFLKAGVRMSDSMSASAIWTNYDEQHLKENGFRLPADPYWLAPPQGSIIPVWHRGGAPNYQPKPMICRLKENPVKVWKRLKGLVPSVVEEEEEEKEQGKLCPFAGREKLAPQSRSGPIIRVFYCSSGTTAARLAIKLEKRLRMMIKGRDAEHQSVAPAAPLNDFQLDSLRAGDLVCIVASCAGRGDVPSNGEALLQMCLRSREAEVSGASFCMFGNGNSSYGANFNGAATKLETALQRAGLSTSLPLFRADTLKEDPPWRQFDSWLSLVETGYRGGSSNTTPIDAVPRGKALEARDNSTELLLPQLSPAAVISIYTPKGGDMTLLALDVGRLEYGHMSHVDIFMPLDEKEIDDLLLMACLTGDELLTFQTGQQITMRKLLSLVDPDRPFTSLSWAAGLGLQLSARDRDELLSLPIKKSLIRRLPIGWQCSAEPETLFDFVMSLPIRRSRTFSTASSQLYWSTQNMGNVLELALKRRSGGLITDKFVSQATRGRRLFVRVRHGPGAHLVSDDKPLVAFTIGSGIAPLRGLLQARCCIASESMTDQVGSPASLFLGFKPGDGDIINEATSEAAELGLVDILRQTPSNAARERAQDKVFDHPAEIVRKIRDEGANVFVCASKEAADEFAANIEAILGVRSIRQALGSRWIEEVYVYTEEA
ncbi:hypothetical protein L249_7145 [Ophiocordyceps polyrhachis-furcata BCC 54312]|uniref:nitric-oxide synthase (NADPH) n=1 Tax=Ophiocordyceps polyrhachis-furcata BCC 54312 TaxID=1330021 RepID=A0A367LAE8_9HYPO|nr:hypothetical protein L249_7145 [Ophiocordyceps polyrhachis-furcata BCC 54312]